MTDTSEWKQELLNQLNNIRRSMEDLRKDMNLIEEMIEGRKARGEDV